MNHKQTIQDYQNNSNHGHQSKRFPINKNKRKHSYKEAGIIHRIGTGYVDLLQRDHTVVRVLTRHINKIKWVDHHCRNKCLDHVDFKKACRGRDHDLHCSLCSQHHRDCRCGVNSRDRYIDSSHGSYYSLCGRHHQDYSCGVNSRERFINSYIDKHCPHCRKHHQDCHCGNQFDRIKDPVIPYCDDRIQLRLAGLTDSFQYKLFQHKGCRVVLELDLSETLD